MKKLGNCEDRPEMICENFDRGTNNTVGTALENWEPIGIPIFLDDFTISQKFQGLKISLKISTRKCS